MGIIDIDINMIPYTFEVELSGKIYEFEINYNYIFDSFTVSLRQGENILVRDEKLVLDEQLFRECSVDADNNIDLRFPNEVLFVHSDDDTDTRVSIYNLGETVFLYYATREELKEFDLNEEVTVNELINVQKKN